MDATVSLFTLPAVIIALSALVGLIVDRIVIARVRAAANARNWAGGDIVARSLEGTLVMLGAIAGAWMALFWLEPSARFERVASVVLLVATIAVATAVTSRLAAGLTRLYSSRTDTVIPQSTIFVNIVRLAVAVIGFLIALNAMGVSITPLLTALGVGGLAVALALQDTLSNLFSGLQLIGSKQIEVGDYIRLETGEEGHVHDLTWRYTAILQPSNNLVIVPNSTLATSRIVNFHRPTLESSVLVPVVVAHDSDLETVELVAIDTAREVMGRLEAPVPDFEPVVRYNLLNDTGVSFNVIMRVREVTEQHALRHEFIKALTARFAAEGIEFASFSRSLGLRERQHTPAG